MYCQYCGKEIPNQSSFCQHCGKNLNIIQTQPPYSMGSNVTGNIPEKQKVTADFTEKDNFSGRNVIQIILGLAILFGMLITTDLDFTYHIAPSFSTLDTFSQKIGFYEGNFTASAAVYLTKYILQAIIIIISCIFLFVISKASTKNRRKAPLAYMIIITVPIMIANLMPFILNAIISLKQRVPGGFLSGEFIGIDNYKMIFSAKPFQSSVLHTLILAVLLTLSVGILSFLLYHSMKYINNRAVITIYCMLSIIPICISKYNFSNLLMSNRTVNNSVTYFLFELIQLTGIALCILGYANLKRNREIVTTDAPIKKVLSYILPTIYSIIPIFMMARLFIYLFGKFDLGTEVTDQIPLFLLLSILTIISSFIAIILLAFPLVSRGRSRILYACILLLVSFGSNRIVDFFVYRELDIFDTVLPYVYYGLPPAIGAFVLAFIFNYSNKYVADYETSSVNFFFKRYLPQMVLPAIVVSTVYFAIKWNAVSYVQLGSREFYSPSLLLYSTYGFVESPTTFLVMIIPISITVIATGIVILTTKKNQALYK